MNKRSSVAWDVHAGGTGGDGRGDVRPGGPIGGRAEIADIENPIKKKERSKVPSHDDQRCSVAVCCPWLRRGCLF